MRDKTFIKIALGWSILGLFLLILIAAFTAPPQVSVIELESNMGKTVAAQGVIDSTSYKEKVAFIDLRDGTGKITVVVFEDLPNKVYKNDEIRVKGKVSEYKGQLEIIADEIFCMSCKG